MSWVAVAVAGAAVVGGVSSNMAADKQAAGGEKALQQQAGATAQARHDLNPWAQYGGYAQANLINEMGIGPGGSFDPNAPLSKPFTLADFNASPAYQWNLQQGTQAINKNANARGNFYAPQTLQDLGKFSQGVASNEFQTAFQNYNTNQNNLFSRLLQISGSGQNAAAGQGGYSMTGANNSGQIMQGIGNVQGAGVMGVGNNIQGGLGDLAQLYMQRQAMQNNQPIQSGGGGSFGP